MSEVHPQQAISSPRCRCRLGTHHCIVPGKQSVTALQVYLNRKANRVINAWVAEGEKWMLEGEDEPALKFRGTSLELHMNWLDRLTFSDGDAYSWKKVRTACESVSDVENNRASCVRGHGLSFAEMSSLGYKIKMSAGHEARNMSEEYWLPYMDETSNLSRKLLRSSSKATHEEPVE